MATKARHLPRREHSLSRERIIEASVALLDHSGETGLTFRALADRLATGPGAIYWHIADKHDLLVAACDAIIARTLAAPPAHESTNTTPQATLRTLALGIFEAFEAHPWIGSVLTQAPGTSPTVRLLDRIGQQVRALGVPHETQWSVVSALLSYIVGVSAQNAANTQLAQARGLDRSNFLDALATTWSQLDPENYPFVTDIAEQLRAHEDEADFLAGIDLLLRGIAAPPSR